MKIDNELKIRLIDKSKTYSKKLERLNNVKGVEFDFDYDEEDKECVLTFGWSMSWLNAFVGKTWEEVEEQLDKFIE